MASPSPLSVASSSKSTRTLYRRYSSLSSELDFSMANEVLPLRVGLETVQIGSWRYTSTDLDDIEILYELESSDLLINTSVSGAGSSAIPALYRIKNISAADLSLVSVVPGSLESMVTSLVLETDEKISYVPHAEAPKGKNKLSEDDKEASHDLDVHIIRMTASVHETGNLRDILLFLKGNYQDELDPNSPFLRERQSPVKRSEDSPEEPTKPSLTLIEGLPHWVQYIPWMLYSRKTRRMLQHILFLYTIISVLWAMWQLYRHVNVIRVVIQPIMAALKYYLFPVVNLFDSMFAVFTLWWHTFLSPLNVLTGLLLSPMLQVFKSLKDLMSPLFLSVTHIFQNTGVIAAITNLFSMLYTVLRLSGSAVWMLFRVLLRPLIYMWQSFLNSRIAVASLDFQRLRLSWVFNLILSSFKSIIKGLMTFVGYTRKEKKIKRAMESNSTPLVSPVSSPPDRRRRKNMPMVYSSPLSKQH